MKYELKREYQEIEIQSIKDIYSIINEYKKIYSLPRKECGEDILPFYRGQSNSQWSIQPSLMRSDKKEHEIIAENNDYPCESLFELIAYIQHYRTGTRFIDFSTDPDVAMFFACSGNENSDGALFVQSFVCHEPDWYTTYAICELSKIREEQISVREFAERLLYSNEHFAELFSERFSDIHILSLYLMSFLNFGIPVLPSKKEIEDIVRVKNQKGCFFICGVDFVTKLDDRTSYLMTHAGTNIFKPNTATVPSMLTVPVNREKHDIKNSDGYRSDGYRLVKIVIPRELKKDILSYLSKEKNITREYLFPDLNS